jgi:hypothetical protein
LCCSRGAASELCAVVYTPNRVRLRCSCGAVEAASVFYVSEDVMKQMVAWIASAVGLGGLSLYISSNRPGGFGGLDIWVSNVPAATTFGERC